MVTAHDFRPTETAEARSFIASESEGFFTRGQIVQYVLVNRPVNRCFAGRITADLPFASGGCIGVRRAWIQSRQFAFESVPRPNCTAQDSCKLPSNNAERVCRSYHPPADA